MSQSPFTQTKCRQCGVDFSIAPGVETTCPKCGTVRKLPARTVWGVTEWGLIICGSLLVALFFALNVSRSNSHGGIGAGEASVFVLSLVGGALAFVLGLLLYFLPTLVADRRNHRHRVAIFVGNLLLGWTFVGWVVFLVWAFMDQTSRQQEQISAQR